MRSSATRGARINATFHIFNNREYKDFLSSCPSFFSLLLVFAHFIQKIVSDFSSSLFHYQSVYVRASVCACRDVISNSGL